MRRGILLAVLPVLLAAACQDEPLGAPGGTRVDSMGVTVWTIPGRDVLAPLKLERLGGLSAPDTGWVVWPHGVAVDPATEAIYVLDESTPRVLVFDFQGRFTGEIGTKGEGPGEYDLPTALSLAANGDLLIMDPGAGVVHRWSNSLEYVGRDRITVGYWGPGFASMGRDLVYTTAGGVETGAMIEALVRVSESGVDTLGTVESRWLPLEMPCGRMPVPEVFSANSVWGAGSGVVAVASVPRYELVLHGTDSPTVVFRRQVPPLAVTQAQAEASVPEGPLQFLVEGCGMTAAGVVRGAGFVSEVSPIFLLTMDPAGRVWAARGLAPDVEAIDVFHADRGFLGSVASEAFPVAFMDESRYLALRETAWGSVLEIWRVAPD